MKNLIIFAIILTLTGTYYYNQNPITLSSQIKSNSRLIENNISNSSNTIETRFQLPEGYVRKDLDTNSFGFYLRTLPLKSIGSKVKYYNGKTKFNNNIYAAVIDLEIGRKNLHQCADAVMRLRADYFWKQKKYDKIHFNFTNGFRVDYNKWAEGYRINIEGNKTYWKKKTEASNSYKSYWKYLEIIFAYAGTLSLSNELNMVSIENLKIGDIFIQAGSPGHAVIVVDVAYHSITNDKIFQLAQSYMPAQELQILINPNNKDLSPWYSTKNLEQLITPEWSFSKEDLKRFND